MIRELLFCSIVQTCSIVLSCKENKIAIVINSIVKWLVFLMISLIVSKQWKRNELLRYPRSKREEQIADIPEGCIKINMDSTDSTVKREEVLEEPKGYDIFLSVGFFFSVRKLSTKFEEYSLYLILMLLVIIVLLLMVWFQL